MSNTRRLVMTGGLAAAVLQDDAQDVLRSAVCPMCHTSANVAQSAIDAGGDWRCVRCGQHWDTARLAAVGAYAAWVGDRDRAGRQDAEGDRFAALHGEVTVERLGGRP